VIARLEKGGKYCNLNQVFGSNFDVLVVGVKTKAASGEAADSMRKSKDG
jgi:hypothetical protein